MGVVAVNRPSILGERRYVNEVLESGFRNSTNGFMVGRLEKAFAEYVGAEHAIAMCNGTATLHTALASLGVPPSFATGVAVPPLTMASTTLAVLHAGAMPKYVDVDPDTWLAADAYIGVSLYGLDVDSGAMIVDAAQTLNPHNDSLFTSYSFQASKILRCGEGGVLATNDPFFAQRARQFSSLGYSLEDSSHIDPATLRRPDSIRHVGMGWNYRMSDLQAAVALAQVERADELLAGRLDLAGRYTEAIDGCDWITAQHVPAGRAHSYWCYAVLLSEDGPSWDAVADAVVRHGGEMPYGAWRLTYHEPAFQHLAPPEGCPVAESIQPRLMQFPTNTYGSNALAAAIRELNG